MPAMIRYLDHWATGAHSPGATKDMSYREAGARKYVEAQSPLDGMVRKFREGGANSVSSTSVVSKPPNRAPVLVGVSNGTRPSKEH
ncbi:hypothetical protein TNCV_69731 [Trichonephila clavipes]|nr:hypothetical protein TNCV_69731 [Trichonephila clavipes]